MESKESGARSQKTQELAGAFGNTLRAERERVGMSLEEASHATRISPSFIQALEEGSFNKLPGVVFARGFIRNLCKVYESSDTEMLKAFDWAQGIEEKAETKAASTPESTESAWQVFKQKAVPVLLEYREKLKQCTARFGLLRQIWQKAKISERLTATTRVFPSLWRKLTLKAKSPAAVAAGAALIVLGGILLVVRDDSQNEPEVAQLGQPEVPPATTGSPPVMVAEAPADSDGATVSQPPQTGAKEERKQTVAAVTAGKSSDQQVVRIEVKTPVLIKVAKDGGSWETKKLDAKTHDIEFSDEAQLLIFDASAVDVSYNGRSLGSLGHKGRIRRISFKNEAAGGKRKM